VKNVSFEVKEDVLHIYVDLKKNFGKSASGKTFIVATTEGAAGLADGTQVNLNVYRKE
jgi:hypothetical protein